MDFCVNTAGFHGGLLEVRRWMGIFSDPVEVVLSTAGLPLRLLWHGRRYTLGAEPLRWYERRDWWVEEDRAERGHGAGLVDQEMWRVQARCDGPGTPCELRTFDLVRYLPGDRWRIIKIHDALVEERGDD
jgi:hypothetical protein